MTKAPVPFLTLLLKFFVLLPKRCDLCHHTFKKSQKYLDRSTNIKKIFLQLRCSNVLLHWKYKPLLCGPKLNLGTFPEEKPWQRTIVP